MKIIVNKHYRKRSLWSAQAKFEAQRMSRVDWIGTRADSSGSRGVFTLGNGR